MFVAIYLFKSNITTKMFILDFKKVTKSTVIDIYPNKQIKIFFLFGSVFCIVFRNTIYKIQIIFIILRKLLTLIRMYLQIKLLIFLNYYLTWCFTK